MTLSAKERRRANEIAKRHDSSRGGSVKTFDRRVSPVSSIDEDQHKTNQVSSRVLSSGATDPERAVGKDHQKNNSTDSRVLASGATDPERAVAPEHQKDNSTNSRILASGGLDANRAVAAEHQKDNSTISRVLASGGPDESRAVGADHIKRLVVGEEHQKANSTDSRVLAGVEGNRAVGGVHIQTNALTARHFPRENNEDILPPGVVVRVAQLPEIWELRGNLGAGRVPPLGGLRGKVGRGQIESRLNGDTLIKDGTLPISALASRPWPSGDAMARIYGRLRDLEKSARNQNDRLNKLENRSHKH